MDLTNAEEVAEINQKADEEIDGIIRKTSHLHEEDSSIGCGFCAKNCPVNAIVMMDGKPTWAKKNCAMCLGCLHR